MVKLIVSDIDGTLIPYGKTTFSPRLMPLIEKLLDKGILFCPASGRQLHSLQQLFEPLSSRLPMLCENGAEIFGPEEEGGKRPILSQLFLPRQEALMIAEDILRIPDCSLFITETTVGYGTDPALTREVHNYTGDESRVIAAPQDVTGDIVKVSAWATGDKRAVFHQLSSLWGHRYKPVFSGGGWVDVTASDKGKGLDVLCKAYGIDRSETAAFGDNYNDLPMLQKAGKAYLMEGADHALKALIPNHCADVCDVLEEILRSV